VSAQHLQCFGQDRGPGAATAPAGDYLSIKPREVIGGRMPAD
jgi:hypothetical protein